MACIDQMLSFLDAVLATNAGDWNPNGGLMFLTEIQSLNEIAKLFLYMKF